MNVINLKTLSLSLLISSSMVSGVLAMETELSDQTTQIQSVKAARAMFDKGLSPVKQTNETSKINFKDDIAKASGPSVKDAGALYNQGLSPVKQTNETSKINFRDDIANAEGTGSKFLQARDKIFFDVEVQTQVVRKEVKELSDSILLQQEELQNLKLEIKRVATETENFKKGILLSKDQGIGWVFTTISSTVSGRFWGGNSSTPQPITNSVAIGGEAIEESARLASKPSLHIVSISASDKGAEELFSQELNSTKEKAESQLKELQNEYNSLKAEIDSARLELAKQKEEGKKAVKEDEIIKAKALFTTDDINHMTSNVTNVASNYNPLSYIWGRQEEKK